MTVIEKISAINEVIIEVFEFTQSNETVKAVCTEVVRTCEGSYSKEFATGLLEKMAKEETEKIL